VVVWGCVAYDGVGNVVFISGIIITICETVYMRTG
jgi:hypothetical protein